MIKIDTKLFDKIETKRIRIFLQDNLGNQNLYVLKLKILEQFNFFKDEIDQPKNVSARLDVNDFGKISITFN